MPRSVLLSLAFWCLALLPATASAAKPRNVRKASPRTGLIITRDDELMHAVKKKDRGALERLAERMGPGHLGEALRRPDPAVVEAALAILPLARGAVLQIGAVADLLDSPNAALATAAADVLGQLLDGAEPSALEDWEVPPDLVDRACGALRALAGRVEAPVASRVAALGALASAATVCTATGELASLLRDPVAAVRRAAILVLRPEERRAASALREVIRDPERLVASAAVATLCRDEPGDAGTGSGSASARTEPPSAPVIELARVMVMARGTPAADAVEMLACLARASTSLDHQILDQLRRGPASPLRDRATELASAPDRLQPQ
ncbi:MAG TPA: hypothetical protein VFH68_06350 [Polyangia bacterium]|nr:hypothetical protein [Polyangia bacterium]